MHHRTNILAVLNSQCLSARSCTPAREDGDYRPLPAGCNLSYVDEALHSSSVITDWQPGYKIELANTEPKLPMPTVPFGFVSGQIEYRASKIRFLVSVLANSCSRPSFQSEVTQDCGMYSAMWLSSHLGRSCLLHPVDGTIVHTVAGNILLCVHWKSLQRNSSAQRDRPLMTCSWYHGRAEAFAICLNSCLDC